jgi:hypothetical protein
VNYCLHQASILQPAQAARSRHAWTTDPGSLTIPLRPALFASTIDSSDAHKSVLQVPMLLWGVPPAVVSKGWK